MPKTLTQHSTGGIVYRHTGRSVDVIMIKDTYGKWTFPKGHVEPNESFEEAAKREIAEETGIDEHILHTKAELGEMDYWFRSPFPSDQGEEEEPVLIHKYVTYYLFELHTEADLSPQEHEIQEVAWVPYDEMGAKNEYEDNQELVQRAKQYITSHLIG